MNCEIEVCEPIEQPRVSLDLDLEDANLNESSLLSQSKDQAAQLNTVDLKGLSNIFDSYATKNTFATGFFNMALIASNFNELKELVSMERDETGWSGVDITLLVLVCISLLLQFTVGIVLVFLAKNGEFIDEDKREMLIRNNNAATLLVITVSIINVFINIFFHM